MRVPFSWLREFCPTALPVDRVADALTAQGVEVERILRPWADLEGVVVARVLDVRDHPRADRLCLATIEAAGTERTVVVGVRNFRDGDLVPYAPPGARLPELDAPLERREIRGESSDGMLCSPKELGISGDHSGILVLDEAFAAGEDVKRVLGLEDEVIDIEVAPNRPDLLSIVGVAREVAAGTGEDLLLPTAADVREGEEKAADVATVEVVDRERCPRYLARAVRGVRMAPSPISAQVRLTAAGMRPLANVVDATNYVMLETGQPMHPFDLALLAGPGIVVRRAEEGEGLVTLDGVERALDQDDLLIADRQKAVAIAGVMGGASSEVSDSTSDVLLESATFEATGILRTARRLGLRTEASIRFERGTDPEAVALAAARAAGLIAAWSGGSVLAGEIDVGEAPRRRTASVRPSRASVLLGYELTDTMVSDALARLRLQATIGDDDVTVEVPGFRVDLVREADLIEEVGRVIGYERVPAPVRGAPQAGGLRRDQRVRRRIRDLLASAGLYEISSSSFVSATDLELFEDARRHGVRIANPISEREDLLRTSLLPGLLDAARRNVAQRAGPVRLFEIGSTFLAGEPDPEETQRVAALLTGPASDRWPREDRELDFLDAKGALEHLLSGLGIEPWSLSELTFAPFHPGRSTEVILPERPPAGELAELHPSVAERLDLPGRVAVFELRVADLVAAASEEVAFRPVSRFPPIRRDLAFSVGRDVPAEAVRAGLVDAGGQLLDRAVLFDVYEGDPLPEDAKSLAFSLEFRAPDRTLTDEEADRLVAAIAERLARDLGAELRSS